MFVDWGRRMPQPGFARLASGRLRCTSFSCVSQSNQPLWRKSNHLQKSRSNLRQWWCRFAPRPGHQRTHQCQYRSRRGPSNCCTVLASPTCGRSAGIAWTRYDWARRHRPRCLRSEHHQPGRHRSGHHRPGRRRPGCHRSGRHRPGRRSGCQRFRHCQEMHRRGGGSCPEECHCT